MAFFAETSGWIVLPFAGVILLLGSRYADKAVDSVIAPSPAAPAEPAAE